MASPALKAWYAWLTELSCNRVSFVPVLEGGSLLSPPSDPSWTELLFYQFRLSPSSAHGYQRLTKQPLTVHVNRSPHWEFRNEWFVLATSRGHCAVWRHTFVPPKYWLPGQSPAAYSVWWINGQVYGPDQVRYTGAGDTLVWPGGSLGGSDNLVYWPLRWKQGTGTTLWSPDKPIVRGPRSHGCVEYRDGVGFQRYLSTRLSTDHGDEGLYLHGWESHWLPHGFARTPALRAWQTLRREHPGTTGWALRVHQPAEGHVERVSEWPPGHTWVYDEERRCGQLRTGTVWPSEAEQRRDTSLPFQVWRDHRDWWVCFNGLPTIPQASGSTTEAGRAAQLGALALSRPLPRHYTNSDQVCAHLLWSLPLFILLLSAVIVVTLFYVRRRPSTVVARVPPG